MSKLVTDVKANAVKKKDLTFEEICPKWAALSMKLGVDAYDGNHRYGGKLLNIGMYSRCAVGEAHCFKTRANEDDEEYYKPNGDFCESCHTFSHKFDELAYSGIFFKEDYDKVTAKFTKHWNLVHNK